MIKSAILALLTFFGLFGFLWFSVMTAGIEQALMAMLLLFLGLFIVVIRGVNR